MKYYLYQTHCDLLQPLRSMAGAAESALKGAPHLGTRYTALQKLKAACAVIDLARLSHKRPAFGIDSIEVHGCTVPVCESAVLRTAFGTLLHFRKVGAPPGQPRVLMVAPMSGHFSTLLRETVRTMLPDHDVYVTDWHNARDVPLGAGRFGFDEYVEHVMEFLQRIGPRVHLMAICQPCVAALAAAALMAEDRHPATPASLVLMAGPIDCRVNPTRVNALASERPLAWFRANLIERVPMRYAGAARWVYPGFVQLAAFMNMNIERHVRALREYYEHVIADDEDKAEGARRFYREYFAVADLPAEFYLETVRRVFQGYDLPLGKLEWRGRMVDPRCIRRIPLLTVEGEKDDICALGQTLAAHDLCTRLPQYLRTHYVQPGAGHYGVFSGKRWERYIFPIVREVIHCAH